MTDNEIMRALELFKSGKDENFAFVSGNALDLINRQKTEIERQNDLLHRQSDVISEQKEKIDRIYAEAVIECADLSIKRICENVTPIPQQRYLVNMCIQEIENTKKEMVGGNNE